MDAGVAMGKEHHPELKGFDSYELTLGDELRGERASKGKSLLDVQRDLRIRADYIVADRRGQLELSAQLLVLLPEESRFSITFRSYFRLPVEPHEERSVRLQTL